MDNDEIERLISIFMDKNETKNDIQNIVTRNENRLVISLDKLREYSSDLVNSLLKNPHKIVGFFEDYLNNTIEEDELNKKIKNKTQEIQRYRVSFSGNFGKNMVSPRGLNSTLTNQLVCVQGIVTRISIPRNLLTKSVHYCENTKQGIVKEYNDSYSITDNNINKENNVVPKVDNNNNPLSFEYGLSEFKHFQTVLIQEPPERTPAGQLPRSIETILQDDLVDKVKPGDKIQITGMFKCIATGGTSITGSFKTCIIATSVQSLSQELNVPKLTGDDIREIRKIADSKNVLDILSNSLAPSIYGSDNIKKALVLQLLGGVEKNLENGAHLRGDVNIMLIGDPSTAKSQFLRHMLSMSPNAIATTGRGSTGVGLTAAVVSDKDTGEKHLEAGAMVLADRGIVCIDEFDKMNEIDRVAIHEVMEQQTVTIAKAGLHVQLNARCSVLAAANPKYGEYQQDLPASRNIDMPDSLLSRFDLVFIVLDEDDPELDRRIADRVIRNHMLPIEIPNIVTAYDEKIIEPDLGTEESNDQIYEKYNALLHGNKKSTHFTKNFLKKYIYYCKNYSEPILTNESSELINKSWLKLREMFYNEKTRKDLRLPITVRTLETLIRLSTAHAKLRLSKTISKNDCDAAEKLLFFTLIGENDDEKEQRELEKEKEKEKLKSEKKSKNKIIDDTNEKVDLHELKSKQKQQDKKTSLDQMKFVKMNITKILDKNETNLKLLWKQCKSDENNPVSSMTELHEILLKMDGIVFFDEMSGTISFLE